MGRCARYQRGRRGQQFDVLGRHVLGQLHHAARQAHRRQHRQATRVGLGLVEAHQADAGRQQQQLHHRCLGRGHQRQRVSVAIEQAHDGRGLRQPLGDDVLGPEAVGVEQSPHQVGDAAALGPDVDAPALELRHRVEPIAADQPPGAVLAIEQPDRLVEQAAQRHQIRWRRFVAASQATGTALYEAEVDARVRVLEQLQVLRRALGRAQFDLDAVLGQRRLVAFAELGVRPLFRPGGQHQLLRRARVECPVGQRQERHRQQHERAGGHQQVAAAQQGVTQGRQAGHWSSRGGASRGRILVQRVRRDMLGASDPRERPGAGDSIWRRTKRRGWRNSASVARFVTDTREWRLAGRVLCLCNDRCPLSRP